MAELRKYSYTAKDSKGKISSGELEAENLEEAHKKLEENGLVVMSVEEEKKWEFTASFLGRRVGAGDKALFSRQLATMMAAGYPLVEALKVISSQTRNKYFKQVIDEVTVDIEGGYSLATAMAKHYDVFNRVYIAVIRSGESSGNLSIVLNDIASELERDYTFSSKLRNALLYPAFILSAMVVIGVLMMIKVIPQLRDIFTDANIKLPWTTRAVLAFSNFLSGFWWLVLLILIAAYVLFRIYLRSPVGNYDWNKLKLRIPVYGSLVEKASMARMSRTFEILAKTGIPLLEAINITAETMDIEVYRRSLKKAATEVERGVPFSSPLIKDQNFPIMIGQMISVGEQTGKIENVFRQMSKHYEGETNRQLKVVASLTEPLTIVILGILVAILVFAIIVPIYNMVEVM